MDRLQSKRRVVVFSDDVLIAQSEIAAAASNARRLLDSNPLAALICFDETTSEAVELDLRGSESDVAARYAEIHAGADSFDALLADALPALAEADGEQPIASRKPGRPKLGVVAREVTLLPRHWEWLATQPGGASVALRRLVEDARRTSAASDARRVSREATYRFMVAIAGDRPGFEEATRALYAGDASRFEELLHPWPHDVRDHALRLAAPALVAVPE